VTDEEGLLQKLREKGRSVSRPSFSAHQLAENTWDVLNDALEAIAEAIRSLIGAFPK
jgi:hypothetical protein